MNGGCLGEYSSVYLIVSLCRHLNHEFWNVFSFSEVSVSEVILSCSSLRLPHTPPEPSFGTTTVSDYLGSSINFNLMVCPFPSPFPFPTTTESSLELRGKPFSGCLVLHDSNINVKGASRPASTALLAQVYNFGFGKLDLLHSFKFLIHLIYRDAMLAFFLLVCVSSFSSPSPNQYVATQNVPLLQERFTSQVATSNLPIPTPLETLPKLFQFADLIVDWNKQINVISRKSCCYETVLFDHIFPSLSLLKSIPFTNSPTRTMQIVDIGTGGGFPGIPLAIACPSHQFTLVDSVNKKLIVVDDIVQQLGLQNVVTKHARAEDLFEYRSTFDLALGRSVANLPAFASLARPILKKECGRLAYVTGGGVSAGTTIEGWRLAETVPIHGTGDKTILVFDKLP